MAPSTFVQPHLQQPPLNVTNYRIDVDTLFKDLLDHDSDGKVDWPTSRVEPSGQTRITVNRPIRRKDGVLTTQLVCVPAHRANISLRTILENQGF